MIDKKKRTRRKQFHFPLVIGENIKKHTKPWDIIDIQTMGEKEKEVVPTVTSTRKNKFLSSVLELLVNKIQKSATVNST